MHWGVGDYVFGVLEHAATAMRRKWVDVRAKPKQEASRRREIRYDNNPNWPRSVYESGKGTRTWKMLAMRRQ
jgi:hypothetical protein